MNDQSLRKVYVGFALEEALRSDEYLEKRKMSSCRPDLNWKNVVLCRSMIVGLWGVKRTLRNIRLWKFHRMPGTTHGEKKSFPDWSHFTNWSED